MSEWTETCESCCGTGGTVASCATCEGHGYISYPRFDEAGQYRLDTLKDQVAAARSVLGVIRMIPQAYHGRGPEFCQHEMARQAQDFLAKLTAAELAQEHMEAVHADGSECPDGCGGE